MLNGMVQCTEIFDTVMEIILGPKQKELEIIKRLIEALEDKDWDCQMDSAYRDHPLFIQAMKELHPEWYEEEQK